MARRAGLTLAGLLALLMMLGDRVAPNSAAEQFADRAWAPPMPLRLDGAAVIAHPLRMHDRLGRTFREDTSQRIEIDWFSRGRLIATRASDPEPLLLFGADTLGRDVLARVAGAARWSLGVAVTGSLLAIALGALFGAIAASGSRLVDRLVVASATALATLPIVYIVLTLRAALPLVMAPRDVFIALALLFGIVGWPLTARGVRGILMRERALDYAQAARAAGASRLRLMTVHLLPATSGFLVTQFLILVPGFLLSEVTLSFLGLGFPEPTPSWGTMLQDASNVRVIADAPWMLAPAAAIAVTSLALHLAAGRPLLSGGAPYTPPGSVARGAPSPRSASSRSSR
ncbi:MAG: ABC transporter permease [Vicinamibacterales bacterium]